MDANAPKQPNRFFFGNKDFATSRPKSTVERIKLFLENRQRESKDFRKYIEEKTINPHLKKLNRHENGGMDDVDSLNESLEKIRNLMSLTDFGRQKYLRNNKTPPQLAIQSREHFVNEFAVPQKYFGHDSRSCKNLDSPFDCIPDSILIKIFSFLTIKSLIIASGACLRWRTLAFDMSLWISVDMHPFRKKLSEFKLIKIIKNYFFESIRVLSLKEYNITQDILKELAKCTTLKSLNVDKCRFIGKFRAIPTEEAFPRGLEELQFSCTTGEMDVMKIIIPTLLTVKNFKMANYFSDKTFDLSELIRSLPEVRTLYLNNRLYFLAIHMMTIANICRNLKSLTVVQALQWQGEGLDDLVKKCKDLEDVKLQMTGLSDYYLNKVAWEYSRITILSISSCRYVTSYGLQNTISKLKYLERLEISSCCDGRAIDDSLVLSLASTDIRDLSLSYSKVLTEDAILTLLRSKPLTKLHLGNCNLITPFIMATLRQYRETIVTISFPRCTNSETESYLWNRYPAF